jgi:hypothetical protein
MFGVFRLRAAPTLLLGLAGAVVLGLLGCDDDSELPCGGELCFWTPRCENNQIVRCEKDEQGCPVYTQTPCPGTDYVCVKGDVVGSGYQAACLAPEDTAPECTDVERWCEGNTANVCYIAEVQGEPPRAKVLYDSVDCSKSGRTCDAPSGICFTPQKN